MLKFLTLDVIRKEYESLASDVGHLSESLRSGINPVKPGQSTYDYAGALQNGWAWLFEYMRVNQPKAYSALAEGQPSLLVGERVWKDRLDPSRLHWASNGFIRLGDRYIVFHPEYANAYIEVTRERHPCYSRYLALPRAIADAYYARMDGLEIVHELPVNAMESRVLPAKMSAWMPAESICQKGKKNREVMQSVLQSVADNCASAQVALEEDFRVILDTREQDNYEPSGDYLLVQEGSQSGRIFHLKNGNFGKLRVVTDPIRLLDEYVAHVFRGDGVFDFLPYSVPI